MRPIALLLLLCCCACDATKAADKKPASISIVTPTGTSDWVMVIGETKIFAVKAQDDQGMPMTGVSVDKWTSSNPAVATIDSQGVVKALSGGWTTLTGTVGDQTAKTLLGVRAQVHFKSLSVSSNHVCGLLADGSAVCWFVMGHSGGADGVASREWYGNPVPTKYKFKQLDVGVGTRDCGTTTDGLALCWAGGSALDALPEEDKKCNGDEPEKCKVPMPMLQFSQGPTLKDVAEVKTDEYHHCAVHTDGKAECWGSNGSGELGTGVAGNTTFPHEVAGNHKFAHVAVGGQFVECSIDTDGKAWTWGGTNAIGPDSLPTEVPGGHKWTAIGVGTSHICGLDDSGQAWCWGLAEEGRVGNDPSTITTFCDPKFKYHPCVTEPVAVQGEARFVELAVGPAHACGLTATGEVYCWGSNGHLRLGVPSEKAEACIDIFSHKSLPCRKTPTKVEGAPAFTHVAVGETNSCALDKDGAAWCWGQVRATDEDMVSADIAKPARVPAGLGPRP